MNISYDYYRVFYFAAIHGSFTRAAAALMTNQPNVTRIISNLEGELGCPLFTRSKRGVALTPEGERLFAHVSAAFEQFQTAERELSLERSLEGGVVSIGASEVALHTFLLPVLKAFREQHPGVHLRLSSHTSPQGVAALQDGLVDFAVVTTPVNVPAGMEQTDLMDIQEVAVVGEVYRKQIKTPASLRTLLDYPIICLGDETVTRDFYGAFFLRHNLTLEPSIELASASQILPMVRSDLGIGFVPEPFLADPIQSAGVWRLYLDKAIPLRKVVLLKRKAYALGIAAGELEKMLRKAAKKG